MLTIGAWLLSGGWKLLALIGGALAGAAVWRQRKQAGVLEERQRVEVRDARAGAAAATAAADARGTGDGDLDRLLERQAAQRDGLMRRPRV